MNDKATTSPSASLTEKSLCADVAYDIDVPRRDQTPAAIPRDVHHMNDAATISSLDVRKQELGDVNTDGSLLDQKPAAIPQVALNAQEPNAMNVEPPLADSSLDWVLQLFAGSSSVRPARFSRIRDPTCAIMDDGTILEVVTQDMPFVCFGLDGRPFNDEWRDTICLFSSQPAVTWNKEIGNQILASLQDEGIQFLIRDKVGTWRQAAPKEIFDKTYQRFRDDRKPKRVNSDSESSSSKRKQRGADEGVQVGCMGQPASSGASLSKQTRFDIELTGGAAEGVQVGQTGQLHLTNDVQNHVDDAKYYAEMALSIQQRREPDSLNLAMTHYKLGCIQKVRNQLDDAQSHFELASLIQERQAPASLELAETYHNLGTVHYKQNRLDDALRNFQLALAIREVPDEDALNLANTYHYIGFVLNKKNMKHEASQYRDKARAIQVMESIDWARAAAEWAAEYLKMGVAAMK